MYAVFVHGLLGLAIVLALVWFVPEYKREFRDHQMALPFLTVWLVEVSDWFVVYWYVVGVAALPFLALDGAIVFCSWKQKRMLGVLWMMFVAFWLFLFAGAAVLGLGIANEELKEGLAR
jgi:type II secretory pathway component PulF